VPHGQLCGLLTGSFAYVYVTGARNPVEVTNPFTRKQNPDDVAFAMDRFGVYVA
jgi:hypothetical protein